MRLTAVFLAVALFGAPLIPATAMGEVTVVTHNDDELLLCTLTLDNLMLNQALECYATERGILVPMGEVCRLIEFGIEVRGADGRASGSLADPATRFEVDMASGTVLVAGKPGRYDPLLVEAHEDDIYVESTLLGTWLGLDVEADRHRATVRLIPSGPLPLQLRIAREKRGGNVQGYMESTDSGFLRVPEPYRFLSGPSIDLAFSPNADFIGTQQVGGYLEVAEQSIIRCQEVNNMVHLGLKMHGKRGLCPKSRARGVANVPEAASAGATDPARGILHGLRRSTFQGQSLGPACGHDYLGRS